ncbi:MAG TPA: hypothetical protein VFL04_02925, partial [Rectinemataceae bacterium]|nr:hypothetical protein [Rectinemataceae bacterium]
PPLFTDAELAGILSPLLLIVGGRDIMLDSRRGAARLSRLLPTARVELVPEAGHALIGYGAEIAAFLDDALAAPEGLGAAVGASGLGGPDAGRAG